MAIRCGDGGSVQVLQATAAEIANPSLACGSSAPSGPRFISYTVNVTVSGIGGAAEVEVSGKGARKKASLTGGSAAVTFTSSDLLESGQQDLVVVVLGSTPGDVKAAKVQRGVNVTLGGSTSIGVGPEDVRPTATVTGLPAEPGVFASVLWLSSSLTSGEVGRKDPSSSAISFPYRLVAGSTSEDRYLAFAQGYGAGGGVGCLFAGNRTRFRVFTGGNVDLALPPLWPARALRVSGDLHPTVSGLSYGGSLPGLSLQGYTIYTIDLGFQYTATLTRGWLDRATSYTLPDLTGLLNYTQSNTPRCVQVNALLGNQAVAAVDNNLFLSPSGFDLAWTTASGNQTVGTPIELP